MTSSIFIRIFTTTTSTKFNKSHFRETLAPTSAQPPTTSRTSGLSQGSFRSFGGLTKAQRMIGTSAGHPGQPGIDGKNMPTLSSIFVRNPVLKCYDIGCRGPNLTTVWGDSDRFSPFPIEGLILTHSDSSSNIETMPLTMTLRIWLKRLTVNEAPICSPRFVPTFRIFGASIFVPHFFSPVDSIASLIDSSAAWGTRAVSAADRLRYFGDLEDRWEDGTWRNFNEVTLWLFNIAMV